MLEVKNIGEALTYWGCEYKGGCSHLRAKSIMGCIYDMGNSNGTRTVISMGDFGLKVDKEIAMLKTYDPTLHKIVFQEYIRDNEVTTKEKAKKLGIGRREWYHKLNMAKAILSYSLKIPME